MSRQNVIYIRQMELEIQGIISLHSIYGQKQYARSNSINFKRKAGGLFVYQVIETAGLRCQDTTD